MTMNLKSFLQSPHIRQPHFVLFGNPVGHSLSPLMHNTAVKYYNLEVQYHAIQLEKNEIHLIDDYLQNENLKGVNLTIPFKYDFIKYCDELDSISSEIRAVNVMVKNQSKWKGYNTDVYGFAQPLKKYSEAINGNHALLFGSGGAAKAVAYALRTMKAKRISVISRDAAKVNEGLRQLVDSVIGYNEWTTIVKEAAILVNTTPLGMNPHSGESPVKDEQIEYLSDKICYDLIYNPAQTKFLSQAERANAVTLNGLEMLIHQGSKIFERWTGKNFPIDIIKKKLQEKLNERN